MIKCPQCKQTLPASYGVCPFCSADVSQVPRPKEAEVGKAPYKRITKGTLFGLYLMSTIYVIFGVVQVLAGIGTFGSVGDFVNHIYMGFGALMAIIGVGMMFRLTAIYGMISIFCVVQVVLGIADIVAAVMTVDAIGLRVFLIVLNIAQLLAAGFMFYFAEETAVHAMSAQ